MSRIATEAPPIRKRARIAVDPETKQFMPGDSVRHSPSGEDWVLIRQDGEHVYPAGWPPSRARAIDCSILERMDAIDRTEWLYKISVGMSEHAAWAKDELRRAVPEQTPRKRAAR